MRLSLSCVRKHTIGHGGPSTRGRGTSPRPLARCWLCAAAPTAPPWLTPPRRCLRGFQVTTGSRTSSRLGTPVCAAARGPVSAAADTASPLDGSRGRWAARQRSCPLWEGHARSNGRCACTPPIRPPRDQKESTGAAALCPCHGLLPPPSPSTRGLCGSLALLEVGQLVFAGRAVCSRAAVAGACSFP